MKVECSGCAIGIVMSPVVCPDCRVENPIECWDCGEEATMPPYCWSCHKEENAWRDEKAEKAEARVAELEAVGRELLNAVDAAEFEAEEAEDGRLDRALDRMSRTLGPPSPATSKGTEP